MKRIRLNRDPLVPLESVVSALLVLVLTAFVASGVIAAGEAILTGDSTMSVASFGEDGACVVATASSNNISGYVSDTTDDAAVSGVNGLRSQAGATADSWRICLDSPTVLQRLAASGEAISVLVFTIGGLYLAKRAISTARQRGIFTEDVAVRVRHLGRFLVVMTVLAPFVVAAARGWVLSSAIDGARWWNELFVPRGSFALVVVALGVVTVARVLQHAVVLQDEVDATV